MMKRVLSAALALSLVSGSVAFADPYGNRGGYSDRGDYRNRGGDRDGWRDRGDYRGDRHWDRRDRRNNGAGTAIAVGVGIFALMAIMASQDRERERAAEYRQANDGYYGDAPPPPPPQYYDDRYGPSPSQPYDRDGR